MSHLFKHIAHPCQPWLRPQRRSNRKWFPISLAGIALVLALTSCTDESSAAPPPISITDTKPVGEGLKVVGYALLGASVVIVMGRLIR